MVESLRVGHAIEVDRIAKKNFGHVLAAAESPSENFEGSRRIFEVRKKMSFINGGARESFEMIERLVRIGRLRHAGQELFQYFGQQQTVRGLIPHRLQI